MGRHRVKKRVRRKDIIDFIVIDSQICTYEGYQSRDTRVNNSEKWIRLRLYKMESKGKIARHHNNNVNNNLLSFLAFISRMSL